MINKIFKTLLVGFSLLSSSLSVQADPIGLIHDIVLTGLNVVGVLGQKSHPNYPANSITKNCYNRYHEDSFSRPVVYFDGYEFSKGAPPPEAYCYVKYPGPAPKYLYNDKRIRVHDRGDCHYIIYRRPGW
jgi:hypothetical protein